MWDVDNKEMCCLPSNISYWCNTQYQIIEILFYDHIAPCQAGHFSGNGNSPCHPCPIGSYQSDTGQTSCKSCPSGYTTIISGATGSLECTSVTTAPPTTTAPPCNIITCKYIL